MEQVNRMLHRARLFPVLFAAVKVRFQCSNRQPPAVIAEESVRQIEVSIPA